MIIDLNGRRSETWVCEEFILLIWSQRYETCWISDFESWVLMLLSCMTVHCKRILFYDFMPILLGLLLYFFWHWICLRCKAIEVDRIILDLSLLRTHITLHVYSVQF